MKELGLLLTLSIVLLISACSGNGGSETKGGKKTVVLSVMTKDRFLETAVRKFEEKNQDVHIEIQEYKALEETGEGGAIEPTSMADVEKYVQSVTTQMISGKGADLILMNNLPQDKFVEKKMLVNLYDLMVKDSSFDRNALYANILKASQDGDGLYVMPLAFSLDLVRGNTELVKKANISVDRDKPWSWSQFKDVARKMKQQNEEYYNVLFTPLLFEYIEENYDQLVGQGNPNFDSDLFRNMMKEIKSMYDEGLISGGISDSGQAVFQMVGIQNPTAALTMPSDMEYYQKPSASGKKEGVPFKSIYSLGLNSKSDVQPEAWEFIKFLLSDEMQAEPDLFGLPMNKGVTDKKLNEVMQKIENGTLDLPIDKLLDGETTKKRIEEVKKLISEAGVQRSSDMKVLNIALEEFESFQSGQKSAEEVSKLIQNRVKTYLNE
ncbi:ABC transporter substrate-binding protein [Paenibacillus solani]|uniref:ABC transporter substrate-binding protein n=1 Tax=Paenibacillus solani TaxID=1705565 RepID=UPI000AED3239|nr:extracellular solute-binding protein [Paenibacillus solani]